MHDILVLLLHQQHFTVPQPPITTDPEPSVVQHRQALLRQSRTASLALRPSGALILCLGLSVKADGAHTHIQVGTDNNRLSCQLLFGIHEKIMQPTWQNLNGTNLTLLVVFQGWSGDPCPGLSGRFSLYDKCCWSFIIFDSIPHFMPRRCFTADPNLVLNLSYCPVHVLEGYLLSDLLCVCYVFPKSITILSYIIYYQLSYARSGGWGGGYCTWRWVRSRSQTQHNYFFPWSRTNKVSQYINTSTYINISTKAQPHYPHSSQTNTEQHHTYIQTFLYWTPISVLHICSSLQQY